MNDKPNKENWETYKVQHQCKLIHIDLSDLNKETWQCEGGLEVVRRDIDPAAVTSLGLLICFLLFFVFVFKQNN